MPFKQIAGGGTVITGESIATYRLVVLKSALKLEMRGIRAIKGKKTAYAILRKEFGLRGGRQKVLDQVQAIIDARMEKEQAQEEGGQREQ